MAETTNIAWCDATFNPWIGCTKVGPGCDGCYAAVSTPARSLGVVWGAGQPRRRTSESNWRKPIAWNARPFYECRDCGWRGETKSNCPSCAAEVTTARRRVFCASLADVFDNEVDPAWRADLFDLIYRTPNLDWLILTKRIGNATRMIAEASLRNDQEIVLPWPNVWLGATIVNQEEADRDIPKLLATPAAKRFVSYEPALGPVDFERGGFSFLHPLHPPPGNKLGWRRGPDWIIVGGESAQPGHPARPFDIQWARDTVRQCREAGVAVFVKQLGSYLAADTKIAGSRTFDETHCEMKDRAGADPAEWPADLRVRCFPD